MTIYVFSIVSTFQIWACHVTNVEKFSEIFQSLDAPLSLEKSPNMSLIFSLVEELLKVFVQREVEVKMNPVRFLRANSPVPVYQILDQLCHLDLVV